MLKTRRDRLIFIGCAICLVFAFGARLNRSRLQIKEGDLNIAIATGNVALVRRLLDEGVNPNARIKTGLGSTRRILNAAASSGNAAIVKLLLDAGAKPAIEDISAALGPYPYFYAVRVLFQYGAYEAKGAGAENHYLLHSVAGYSQYQLSQVHPTTSGLEIVRELLKRGADVNEREPWNNNTPLMRAAEAGNVAVLEELLAHGAQVDAATPEGRTAFYAAISGGQLVTVKALLVHGANLNVNIQELEKSLHVAMERRQPQVVRFINTMRANH